MASAESRVNPLALSADRGPEINVSRLTITYDTGASAVRAVDGMDLHIPAGQFVSVMGPSGSGKTTLFNALAATLRPGEGSVRIGDIEVSGLSEDDATRFRLFNVGLIYQFFNLIPELTVERNIALPLRLQGMSRSLIERRVVELLDYLAIADRRRHLPREISGGEMQRAAIARALAIEPALILADEPTGNLDSRTSDEILALLRRVGNDRGVTIILFTHDQKAISYADRVITLCDGQIETDHEAPPPARG